jgi:hypothetical protein
VALTEFYGKFFADNNSRTYLLGINPGRYVNTATGVPYTDGYALQETCGIENNFSKGRELTAEYINKVIDAFGGATAFYDLFYAGAVFPFEILFDDLYANYYADDVWPEIEESIRTLLKEISQFGSNSRVVVLGSSDNLKHFNSMNDELGLFGKIWSLEHPRYIAQYKRREMDKFIDKYLEVLREAST